MLLGVAVQLAQSQLWPITLYVGITIVSALAIWGGWRVRRRTWFERLRPVCLCLGLAALAFAQTGWRASLRLQDRLPALAEGVNLMVEGQVVGLPHATPDGLRFQFEAERFAASTGILHVSCEPNCLLSLGWYGPTLQPIRSGERWSLPVKLKAPHGHVNPHGFDYELWLWEQNIIATGYVRGTAEASVPQRLSEAPWWTLSHWRESARDAVQRKVNDPMTAGWIAGLLLGDQASIASADWNVFRATAVAHLMAISGLHITGIAWLAGCVIGALWRRASWRGVAWALWWATPSVSRMASVVAAISYAAFSGWGVPAQRTVWMLCIVHALALNGRRWPWPLTGSFVAAVVLVWDPWAMLQAGFVLSFVAVGLLFVSGESMPQTQDRIAFTWRARARQAFARMWREQVLMSVCLAPLSLILFHQVSMVGLLANLWAVPWVTLVVTPLCLIGLGWSDAWLGAAWAIEVMRPLLQSMATWPFAQWSIAAAPIGIGIVAVLGGVWMAMPGPWAWRITGLCWCLPLMTWQVNRPLKGEFELWAADMGQGHAVLVRTQHHALLYDTGPRYSRESDAGQRVIVPLLRALDERLDRVVVSHQDIDHSGGLPAVMTMQSQADVLTSVSLSHPMMTGLRAHLCHQGQHWEWDGVEFEVMHPRKQDLAGKPNAISCVLRVRAADGVNALLVGDIEAEQEQALVAAGALERTDWLLVPHHGSNTSSTTAFLRAVQPTWAVVQAGYRNRYGHPREEVLQRYAREGISVVQTPQCGASIWRSSAPNQMGCERQQHPHYWHHTVHQKVP